MNETDDAHPNPRARLPRWGLVALGVVAVAGAGLALGTSEADATDPGDRYGTNEAGSSYGSLFDSASPDDEPDLIRVLATNGREGYVYESDLHPADLEPANPQEAIELQDARDLTAATVFVDTLADELGTDLTATEGDALAVYRAAVDASHALGDDRVQDALSTALSTIGADPDATAQTPTIHEALLSAAEAVQRELPVYESDGTTQIGIFVTG